MDKFYIQGGRPLNGELRIAGAKNAVLPIIAASLLSAGEITIDNIPLLADVQTMLILLTQMGVGFKMVAENCLLINAADIHNCVAPYEHVRTMRASILVLGPLLARYGEARVSLPGGCAIGSRPIDIHLQGLSAMGAEIIIEQGYIDARAKEGLHGTEIDLPQITVTGTENLMMAAVLAKGQTILRHAAREPEVIDLANFLNQLGADISGSGSSEITINGVSALCGANYTVMPDRIEAGTFLAAALITGGHVKLNDVRAKDLHAVLELMRQAGAKIDVGDNWIELQMDGLPHAVNVTTAPYPGFPTDMQAQIMAVNTIAQGEGGVTELVFENRFMHVQELIRMGADINLDGHTAYCRGVKQLIGAPVMATDLRASAGLVLAGLAAKGETVIDRVYHIDRGYVSIEKRLSHLGAKIERVSG